MLDQNPFLEADDEAPGEAPVERAASAEPPPEPVAEASADRDDTTFDGGDDAPGIDNTAFDTMERRDWENGTEGDDFDGVRELPSSSAGAAADDDQEAQDRTAAAPSLQDHLRGQLALMRLSPEERAALWTLIESLDADGYLADSLEEIADRLGASDPTLVAESGDGDGLLERLQCALNWLQEALLRKMHRHCIMQGSTLLLSFIIPRLSKQDLRIIVPYCLRKLQPTRHHPLLFITRPKQWSKLPSRPI